MGYNMRFRILSSDACTLVVGEGGYRYGMGKLHYGSSVASAYPTYT